MNDNHAFLILAHSKYELLKQLIHQILSNSKAHLYIHICLNASEQFAKTIQKEFGQYRRIFILTKRHRAYWGNINLVHATLEGLYSIQNSKIDYSHIHLLSGQCFPLVSWSKFNLFFEKNLNHSYMDFHLLPYSDWKDGGLTRINRFHTAKDKRKRSLTNLILDGISYFLYKIKIKHRFHPKNIKPYGGSQWWSISYKAMEYIIAYSQKNPKLLHFHKYSVAPDELYFQTVLLNCKIDSIRNNIINNNLRYINFENKRSSPKVLTQKDWKYIEESNCLFARKIDYKQSEELIWKIVEHIRIN